MIDFFLDPHGKVAVVKDDDQKIGTFDSRCALLEKLENLANLNRMSPKRFIELRDRAVRCVHMPWNTNKIKLHFEIELPPSLDLNSQDIKEVVKDLQNLVETDIQLIVNEFSEKLLKNSKQQHN